MMRERHECARCGESEFRVTPSFVVQVADQPVESLVWRCVACGGETLVVEALVEPIDDAATVRRGVAA